MKSKKTKKNVLIPKPAFVDSLRIAVPSLAPFMSAYRAAIMKLLCAVAFVPLVASQLSQRNKAYLRNNCEKISDCEPPTGNPCCYCEEGGLGDTAFWCAPCLGIDPYNLLECVDAYATNKTYGYRNNDLCVPFKIHEECESSHQCEGDLICGSSGQCAEPVGGRCRNKNDCDDDLICVKLCGYCGDKGTCTDKSAGSQCSDEGDCDEGLRCSSNRCLKQIGADCESSSECETANCYNGQCKVATQDACTKDSDCATSFCLDGKCSKGNNGANCASNADCGDPNVCFVNVCRIPEYASCQYDAECASGLCKNTRCARGSAGDSCTQSDNCMSGLVCSSNTCLVPDNGNCTESSDCVSGICQDQKCSRGGNGANCNGNEGKFFHKQQ